MKLIVSSDFLKIGVEQNRDLAEAAHYDAADNTVDVGLLGFVNLQESLGITLKVVRRGAEYHILTAGVGE